MFTKRFFPSRFRPSLDILLISQYTRNIKTNYLHFAENRVFLLKEANYPIPYIQSMTWINICKHWASEQSLEKTLKHATIQCLINQSHLYTTSMTKRSAEHPQVNVSDHQIFKVGFFMSNSVVLQSCIIHRFLESLMLQTKAIPAPTTSQVLWKTNSLLKLSKYKTVTSLSQSWQSCYLQITITVCKSYGQVQY